MCRYVLIATVVLWARGASSKLGRAYREELFAARVPSVPPRTLNIYALPGNPSRTQVERHLSGINYAMQRVVNESVLPDDVQVRWVETVVFSQFSCFSFVFCSKFEVSSDTCFW